MAVEQEDDDARFKNQLKNNLRVSVLYCSIYQQLGVRFVGIKP